MTLNKYWPLTKIQTKKPYPNLFTDFYKLYRFEEKVSPIFFFATLQRFKKNALKVSSLIPHEKSETTNFPANLTFFIPWFTQEMLAFRKILWFSDDFKGNRRKNLHNIFEALQSGKEEKWILSRVREKVRCEKKCRWKIMSKAIEENYDKRTCIKIQFTMEIYV